MDKIKIAISSCLAGNPVRYDGREKLSKAYQLLLEEFELIAICPEVGIGLSVPRPPIQLVKVTEQIEVQMIADPAQEFGNKLRAYAESQFSVIEQCSGYICAQKSPSCGFQTTPLYDSNNQLISAKASGAFIEVIAERFSELPIVNQWDLETSGQIATFAEQVRNYKAKRLPRSFVARNDES